MTKELDYFMKIMKYQSSNSWGERSLNENVKKGLKVEIPLKI